MSKIKIKNSFPHLMSAVMNHDDCPEWIQNAVIDGFNSLNTEYNFSLKYFAYMLENCPEPRQCEVCQKTVFTDNLFIHSQCLEAQKDTVRINQAIEEAFEEKAEVSE